MTVSPLDQLCRDLVQEFERDPKGSGVVRLLGEYATKHDDWREFITHSTERYTRNLAHRCKHYELLVLAWGEGQESPIHNHDGNSCWMAVLDGELEELHFSEPVERPNPLIRGRVSRYTQGDVGFIQDQIALHLIRPASGATGVSLHLYANPIDQCRIYDLETSESELVELGYCPVRGEPCDRPADEVRADWAESRA